MPLHAAIASWAGADQGDESRQGRGQLVSYDDAVDEAMFLDILRNLESLGQLINPHELLDHGLACKTDPGTWLGNDQVTKHGQARRHAAVGRICQEAHIQQSMIG